MNIHQYKEMHAAGAFAGHSTQKWSADIKEMLKRNSVQTVMDYGCGKGMQYKVQKLHHDWGVEEPYLYEPAVPGMDALPGQNFDAVLCVDVLEHLEGMELFECIKNVLAYADKCAFFAITCRPAKKHLPDGRNCHITIQPPIWWRGYIQAISDRLCKKDLDIVLRFEE